MGMTKFRIVGVLDGAEKPLPQDLDGIVIETPTGGIYIDIRPTELGGVMVRGVSDDTGKRPTVVMSVLETGRLLLGVATGKQV